MTRPELHLFVCNNERPVGGKPSCGARGAAEVMAAFQRELGGDPTLWGRIAVTPCGCLGPCFEGPMIAVYPDGVWYQRVSAADVGEIVASHVRGGVPVPIDRLRYRFEE